MMLECGGEGNGKSSGQRVKSAELLEPVANVKGPATESPPADNRVHDAPFHPSPKLSSMLSVWEPEVRDSVGFADEE
jgi:hypothetical protein